VAVASAGPYASLYLTPDRQPCQLPTTLFFRPDALLAAKKYVVKNVCHLFVRMAHAVCDTSSTFVLHILFPFGIKNPVMNLKKILLF